MQELFLILIAIYITIVRFFLKENGANTNQSNNTGTTHLL